MVRRERAHDLESGRVLPGRLEFGDHTAAQSLALLAVSLPIADKSSLHTLSLSLWLETVRQRF